MAYGQFGTPAYRGDAVLNTRVDRPDEGLPTEQVGAGGTGLARSTFDRGMGGAARLRGATTVVDTTAIGLAPSASLARAIAGAPVSPLPAGNDEW